MFPTIDFTAKPTVKYDTAIIGVFDDKKLTASAKTIDSVLGGVLSHQLSSHKNFEAKEGHSLTVALSVKAPYLRVILVGLGDAKKTTEQGLETIGGILASALKTQGSTNAIFLNSDDLDITKFDGHSAPSIGFGVLLGHYEFNHYKTTMPKPKTKLARLTFLTNEDKKLTKEFIDQKNLAESTCLVRDVVNQPPNILYPETFANHIKKTLTPLGVKVEILSKSEIKKRGLGLLYAVGQASEFEPKLVVMTWNGAGAASKKGGKTTKSKQKPIAFVGKGMTYDSGGLSIKPADYMMTMKGDMAGAGAVFGLMHMLAKRKCAYPVIGITPLAENAISDEAYRPDDIIKSYSGKYVEVLNTDAEGRLILADALTYVQKHYDPELVVNLATLTGAILVALGTEYAGTFVNDDGLWNQLNKASNATGEKLWRMPLADHFRREMDTPMADIKNIGAGRYGGSCTAAAFLQEFIDKDRKWAHLDIAGTATTSKPRATNPVPFGTGYGVRLLNDFMKENYG